MGGELRVGWKICLKISNFSSKRTNEDDVDATNPNEDEARSKTRFSSVHYGVLVYVCVCEIDDESVS